MQIADNKYNDWHSKMSVKQDIVSTAVVDTTSVYAPSYYSTYCCILSIKTE